MTEHRVPGRSLVTRRALVDIIRPAVSGSYGVLGFASATRWERIRGWLGLANPGIRISLGEGLAIDLHLTVAYGLPVAEVARQADSAVRYAISRALGREVDRLTIHVGGLRYQPAAPTIVPPPEPTRSPVAVEALVEVEAELLAAVESGGEPA